MPQFVILSKVSARIFLFLGLLSLSLAQEAAVSVPDRVLAIGDHLRYQVEEDGDPAVDMVVSNTGMLNLPYYGPIEAVGKTLDQMKAKIKESLEKDLYVKATVRLQMLEFSVGTLNRGRVHLSGEVRKIGPVDIDTSEKTTLSQVILASGGLGDFADAKNVRVIRREGDQYKTITVDLREVLEKGHMDKDIELKDGDFIIVDQKLINW